MGRGLGLELQLRKPSSAAAACTSPVCCYLAGEDRFVPAPAGGSLPPILRPSPSPTIAAFGHLVFPNYTSRWHSKTELAADLTPISPDSQRAMQEKKLTLLQTVAAAGVFSAVSFWYGFMFGRESARRELGGIIDDLRSNKPTTISAASSEPDAHSKP
ncbi:uncharacterized protein [Miscanthus floridulus]|uniref:uncharacterized protein isoform X1 n=1 Tax=Miscanthus floridulus TaxID=154761 RepID=UPI00345A62AD